MPTNSATPKLIAIIAIIIAEIVLIKIFGLISLLIILAVNLLLAVGLYYGYEDSFKIAQEAVITLALTPCYAIPTIKSFMQNKSSKSQIFMVLFGLAFVFLPFIIPPPVDYLMCYFLIATGLIAFFAFKNNSSSSEGNTIKISHKIWPIALICLTLPLLTAANILPIWCLFLPSIIATVFYFIKGSAADLVENTTDNDCSKTQDFLTKCGELISDLVEPFFQQEAANKNNTESKLQ